MADLRALVEGLGYRNVRTLLNSGNVSLLDDERLVSQVCALERKTSRTGKDSVNHPPGGNDDRINAAAGAIVFASVETHYDAAAIALARISH